MSIYLNKKVAEIRLFRQFYHIDSLTTSTETELKLNNYDSFCHNSPADGAKKRVECGSFTEIYM